jgi:hypothetical protein
MTGALAAAGALLALAPSTQALALTFFLCGPAGSILREGTAKKGPILAKGGRYSFFAKEGRRKTLFGSEVGLQSQSLVSFSISEEEVPHIPVISLSTEIEGRRVT